MTKDEIIVGNELISKFMNVEETQGHYNSYGAEVPTYQIVHNLYNGRSYSKPALSYKAFLNRAEYSFNWQWIMPVIEKIESLGYTVIIKTNMSCISRDNKGNRDSDLVKAEFGNGSKLEKTYSCVVSTIEYLNWHNKQK